MASSTTIVRPEVYPAGTVVKLFQVPSPMPGEVLRRNAGNPENWKPALVKVAEATVNANGELTFSSLFPLTGYLAWAQVSSIDNYLAVRVPTDAPQTGQEPWSEEEVVETAAECICKIATPAGRRRVITAVSATCAALGAVAEAKVLAVTCKAGANFIFRRMLEQPKTTEKGVVTGFNLQGLAIAFNPGENVGLVCEAPSANVRVALNMSGYME